MTQETELSLDFITGLTKIELPPIIVARAGWKLDVNALIAACGVLDLQRPVKVRFTSGGSKNGFGTLGAYRVKIDLEKMEYYHGITISQDLSYDDGNEYLWHEFRHAWQAEAYAKVSKKSIDGFHVAAKSADGPHGASYHLNKFEIDARAFAKRMVAEGHMLLIPKGPST